MNEITSAIDNLRREMRHDLKEVRAIVTGLGEIIQEDGKGLVKVEGELALLEQKCISMTQRMMLLKAEVEVLDADVSCLKRDRAQVKGNWQTLVVVAAIASTAGHFIIKWMDL